MSWGQSRLAALDHPTTLGVGILLRAVSSHMMRGRHRYDRVLCIALGQPQVIGVVFGQLVVLALAIDRYSAVRMPCQYLHINLKAGLD